MSKCCRQFGFDSKKIKQRLGFSYLSKNDFPLASRLQEEVIIPNLDKITDRFYEILLFQSESRQYLCSGEVIERLKKTQKQYLLTLGKDFDSEEYFEGRLKIGVVHAVIGLPLSVYQCAYSNLTQLIIDCIPGSISNNKKEFTEMINFIIKITSLDMSLAVETYHSSHISSMKEAVEDYRSRESELRTKAETDSLTGMFNRESFFKHFHSAITNMEKDSKSLVHVIMVDLDHFKSINDEYGHQVGDEALIKAAESISQATRAHDFVGRYGGEEFIIGIINVNDEVANIVAKRICQRISEITINIKKSSINITASVGLASIQINEDLTSLIGRADSALYVAKKNGRNQVVID